ncbi:hypothetical protein SEVIR_3G051700v4 [Setaria viridis]
MMEAKGDQDALLDLESGNGAAGSNNNSGVDASFSVGQGRTAPNGAWNGCVGANGCLKDDRNQHMDCSPPALDAVAKNGDDRKSEGEDKLGLLDSSGGEKAKKKRSKKPPRPPRPSTPTPLDVSDQKLLNELSELAMLKRARIERMKALKKMKNAKQGSSGFFSGHGSAVSFHGSPESSIRAHSSLISIRFYKKNHSNVRPPSVTTAAPDNVETVSSLVNHNQARRLSR